MEHHLNLIPEENSNLFIFLSHDVDWPIHGPGVDHILKRKDRFSLNIIKKVLEEKYNPYYNIPDVMEIEERYKVRSTFFFRPTYENGNVEEYADVIKSLIKGGWEIGVHLNNVSSLENVACEKKLVEKVAQVETYGSRVHYLRISLEKLQYIREAGFLYDSSFCFVKNRIDTRNMGFFIYKGLIVFPITIMDTYLFTYMRINEKDIVRTVNRAVKLALENQVKIITILWHDSSLKMKGGRMYAKVVESLVSNEKIKLIKGVDLAKLIRKVYYHDNA